MGCKWRNYESRLRLTKLTSLETRVNRADMLEVFKILNGLERVELGIFFQRNERRGRRHVFKLFKKRVRLDVAKYIFANRVCDRWNRLPEDVVSSPSVNVFKSRLDNYLGKSRGI